jgi:hypothetical protein
MARQGYTVPRNTAHRNGALLPVRVFLAARENSVSVKGLAFCHFLDCKTVYPGSIPGVASTRKINHLAANPERKVRRKKEGW